MGCRRLRHFSLQEMKWVKGRLLEFTKGSDVDILYDPTGTAGLASTRFGQARPVSRGPCAQSFSTFGLDEVSEKPGKLVDVPLRPVHMKADHACRDREAHGGYWGFQ